MILDGPVQETSSYFVIWFQLLYTGYTNTHGEGWGIYTGGVYVHCIVYEIQGHSDSVMQKRRNSIASAMELRLFCIKSSIYNKKSHFSAKCI